MMSSRLDELISHVKLRDCLLLEFSTAFSGLWLSSGFLFKIETGKLDRESGDCSTNSEPGQ